MSKMRIGGRGTSFAFAPGSTVGKGRGRGGEEEICQGYVRIYYANKKIRKQHSVLKIKRLPFLFFTGIYGGTSLRQSGNVITDRGGGSRGRKGRTLLFRLLHI